MHAAVSARVEKNGKVDTDASVTIQNLRIDGQAILVTGKPNQRVDLPEAGWLIINEQVSSGSKTTGDIAVSALHFVVCHCIEGHIGLVRAGITADDDPPALEGDCGKVTGGGWITGTLSGAKGSFGMSGGIRRGGGNIQLHKCPPGWQ